jgi:glycosyltransferase involved in cell wall biosynthesis
MGARERLEAGPSARLRIGFFGVFYPGSERAGSFSTSLVWELARSSRVERVHVYGPTGARRPDGGDPRRLAVEEAWAADDPLSLLRALARMWRARRTTDAYLFSIYVTAFGRRSIANVVGLLLPPILRIAARRPVFVYMHNFLETQDSETLGFRVGRLTKTGVRLLERTLIALTRVVVPLRSMQTVVEREVGGRVEVLLLPYLEALFAATRPGVAPASSMAAPPLPPLRVLLFGYWGPQKDLTGALDVLGGLAAEGCPLDVTVAGEANPGFPEYRERLERAKGSLPVERFHFVGRVDEEEVFPLVRRHHLLLLPYRATGGISGVMNVGALADLDLLAYDVPQLREFSGELGERVRFVPAGDSSALREAILAEVTRRASRGGKEDLFQEHVATARAGVERLVDRMVSPGRPLEVRSGPPRHDVAN